MVKTKTEKYTTWKFNLHPNKSNCCWEFENDEEEKEFHDTLNECIWEGYEPEVNTYHDEEENEHFVEIVIDHTNKKWFIYEETEETLYRKHGYKEL